MLVLTRRKDQRVMIGRDGIVCQVVEIGAGYVRLGFEAPAEVGIDREEVRKAKEAEARNAHATADQENRESLAGYHGLPDAREEPR